MERPRGSVGIERRIKWGTSVLGNPIWALGGRLLPPLRDCRGEERGTPSQADTNIQYYRVHQRYDRSIGHYVSPLHQGLDMTPFSPSISQLSAGGTSLNFYIKSAPDDIWRLWKLKGKILMILSGKLEPTQRMHKFVFTFGKLLAVTLLRLWPKMMRRIVIIGVPAVIGCRPARRLGEEWSHCESLLSVFQPPTPHCPPSHPPPSHHPPPPPPLPAPPTPSPPLLILHKI